MSLVEKLICNPDFSYLQPYFLACDLEKMNKRYGG